jgi:hypothetical protein
VVVVVSIRNGILVWMHVPSKIPTRIVTIMNVVIVSNRPPDSDGRSSRLADAVIKMETQFTGIHRVVKGPTRKRFKPLKFGAKIMECAGVDSAS